MYKMSRDERNVWSYTFYTALSSNYYQFWNEGWHLSPSSCTHAACLKTHTPGNIFVCFLTFSLNHTTWMFNVTLIMKLNRTVVAGVAMQSASVYISRRVEHGMIDGSIQQDIRFINLSGLTCKFSALGGRNCSGPSWPNHSEDEGSILLLKICIQLQDYRS
jgi:hypothetical protein